MLTIPDSLAARRADGPAWGTWLDELPNRVLGLCAEWQLAIDGPPLHGHCSLVVPVRTRAGAPAMLKVGFDGDEESTHEALALSRWAGRGAVDLLRADPHRRALLLERLGTTGMQELWDIQACEIIASRYAELHLPSGPPFERLNDRLGVWEPGLKALLNGGPVPRRMVEQALSLTRDFIGEDGDQRLLHFDLHYDNMLPLIAADSWSTAPADWVVIDPKPLVGDPHAEVAPLLSNRFEELANDLRAGLRRRFEATVDAAEFDEDRARDWVIVRMLLNISWTVQHLGATRPTGAAKDWITRCLTIAKAVQ